MTTLAKTSAEIRAERRREPQTGVPDLLFVCPWPKKGENLGTLARTADALDAGMAIPPTAIAREALRRGDTIGRHNMRLLDWNWEWRLRADRIVAVELAHNAIPLSELRPMGPGERIQVWLGHEVTGIPAEALAFADEVVEIPMVGVGNSLNVAVAGSLVGYKLRGWV